MRNISVFFFEFGLVVQVDMSFKNIYYLHLWRSFSLAEQKDLCNFGKWHFEEYFCESILNLDHGSGGEVV